MSDTGSRDLAWSTPADAVRLIVRGVTARTASRVAAVVGSLLTLVNQGGVLAAGGVGVATWLRIAANYVIPYTVASIGYLAPFRRR